MRLMIPCFLGLLFCLLPDCVQAQVHPRPPGLQEAEKKERLPLEPPRPPRSKGGDPAQLKREADELARLAQAIPAQVERVRQGQLPKDLIEKLKQIEKLAKQLRSDILP